MNNLTIGDKLGLSGQVKELKLGKSFDSGINSNTPGFHTFRYDFKPASVDASQVAKVNVEQRHQVAVTVPHHDSTSSTTFRGSQRPYQKECVLIIDHKTGEVTLEKLSCNVQLKKTRAEGSSKVSLGAQNVPTHGRPLTPSTATNQNSVPIVENDVQPPVPRIKRPSPPMPQQRVHSGSPVNVKPRMGSAGNSSHRQAPAKNVARPAPASLAANSMPMLLDDTGRFDDAGLNMLPQQSETPVPPVAAPSNTSQQFSSSQKAPPSMPQLDANTDVVQMSEGSSSSSSSSGSSSENSDSDSDSDAQSSKAAPTVAQPPPPPSMPTLLPTNSFGLQQTPVTKPSVKLCTLSEDLQLSESGSDSD